MKPTEQRHVIVVGMHRSGTSAVADAIARLGLALPDETDLITPGPYNERGYWESRRFVTYSDRILRYLHGTWSAPPKPAAGWEQSMDAEVVELRSGARDFSLREFTERHMVLKDPRLCITLPLWRQVFDQAPVAVLVLRDPLEVARSLEHRNQFPISYSLALWRRYVQQSLTAVDGLPVFVAEYQRLLDDPRTELDELTTFLGTHGITTAVDTHIDDAVEAFAPELRHHRADPGGMPEAVPILVSEQREFFDALRTRRGGHEHWSLPPGPDEPSWVHDILQMATFGEITDFERQAAQDELKWIKRSRLFGATRTIWRVTASGPTLSEDAPSGEVAPAASTPTPTLTRLSSWSQTARRAVSARKGPATRPGQVGHEDNPDHPVVLEDFPIFAVIKSWMDEDIIEATVRNAFAQGADTVFLVDNASTDSTVARAVEAGATVAEVYETEAFDGRLVQPLVNAVVARESLRDGSDHIWWMLLDSDEFPEGPGGRTIREYLAGLDRRFRLVGARFLNHLPDTTPANVEGFHPADFQPLCYPFEPLNNPPCSLGHWKHLLQRFDRHGQFLLSNEGAHTAFASERVIEPSAGVLVHHFQYRNEAFTRAKLDLVHESHRDGLHESAGWSSFDRRRRSLDAVYDQRWAEVDTPPNRVAGASAHPAPWSGQSTLRRWYPEASVHEARHAASVTDAGLRRNQPAP